MNSIKIDIFFSCSFQAEDEEVNQYFMAICEALDLQLTNVSTGSAETPPEVAKKKISAAQALVAICTARSEFKNGKFAMPQAVHDEISFAFGKDIPVLMIVEQTVEIAGFKPNFGTYLSFQREKLNSPEFMKQAVEAIHSLKMHVIEPHHVVSSLGNTDAYAEYVHHMIELKHEADDFVWQYSTTKKLMYTKPSKRGITSSAWQTLPVTLPGNPPPIDFKFTQIGASKNIKMTHQIERQDSHCLEAVIRMDPPPEEHDQVEFSTVITSRYINPVWEDECPPTVQVRLDDGDYKCADGLIFAHRTKKAVIEFRFAREYGFRPSSIRPFVGSYTTIVDYEIESELKRAKVRTEEFGGSIVIRMEVESPLPNHMYGVAWNPRPRPINPESGGSGKLRSSSQPA